MPSDINFLRERRKSFSKQQQLDRKLLKAGVIFLGGVIVFVIFVMGVEFFFNLRLKKVIETSAATRVQIVSQEDVEKSFVILVNKLSILAELNANRQSKQEAISFFSTVFGDKVIIRQIEYDGSNQLLNFSLNSEDVFVMERVLQQLKSDDIKSKFTQLSASHLVRSPDGSYEIRVSVVMKPVEIK